MPGQINAPLNIFYQEPDPDRWFKYDRYPRRIIRRLVRGRQLPGGQKMVFLNLLKGLDRINQPYRVNDFAFARRNPESLACIIGKPNLLFERPWKNPILFGAAVFSHPLDCPDLLERYPVKKVIVPGKWMQKMFHAYYGDKVIDWPVGIDTRRWQPSACTKDLDFLIYHKIRWEQSHFESSLVEPIISELRKRYLSFQIIRYGSYKPDQLLDLASRSKAAIFLCEHETQGLAYQQLLSMNIPVLAWDRGGYWQDPAYYPHKVQFNDGVSSVPYWDERCGMKFWDLPDFSAQLDNLLSRLPAFQPRSYILENLTLEICARRYLEIVDQLR